MNCLILDDDKNFSLKLKKDVEKFLDNIFSKYSIDIINENFNNIANYAKCNLIFVDIDLKESNGIDLVKKLQLFTFLQDKNLFFLLYLLHLFILYVSKIMMEILKMYLNF